MTTDTPASLPDWLYLTRRLELLTLPLGRADGVVTVGGRTYYRLTPAVLVWFEHAIADLDATRPGEDQVAAVVAAQREVYAFARRHFAPGELDAARRAGPRPLPELPPCPRL